MPELASWISALHLASPALPVGAFSYSQGLESACAHGLVSDEPTAMHWIAAVLATTLERLEAPIWILQYDAWASGDWRAAARWNDWFLATRETAELRLETEQMGWSMVRLIDDLGLGAASARAALLAMTPIAYPAAASFAYAARSVPSELGLAAYCFAWLEGQVAAAVKIVPLGQTAGQRILLQLAPRLSGVVNGTPLRVRNAPESLESFAPQLAILSARHETQYSRLYRS